jgi:hypothetical protein
MHFTLYFVYWLNQEGMDCSRRVNRPIITLMFLVNYLEKQPHSRNRRKKLDNIKINFVILPCEDVIVQRKLRNLWWEWRRIVHASNSVTIAMKYGKLNKHGMNQFQTHVIPNISSMYLFSVVYIDSLSIRLRERRDQ